MGGGQFGLFAIERRRFRASIAAGRGSKSLAKASPDDQRLAGATLLVFANKQDLAGSLSHEQISNVRKLAESQKLTTVTRAAIYRIP